MISVSKHKMFWYRPKNGKTNFGDELGQIFLRELGHEIEWAPMKESTLLSTGTLLQRANDWRLPPEAKIWGTGWGHIPIRNIGWEILAVRGALTETALGLAPGSVPYGDAGLLASHFWPAKEKKYKIGFVRHYLDRQIAPRNDIEIQATLPPQEVCEKISECEVILSSSLHGCIVAASYGIPFMRVYSPRVGRPQKWEDFASSLATPLEELQRGLLKAAEKI